MSGGPQEQPKAHVVVGLPPPGNPARFRALIDELVLEHDQVVDRVANGHWEEHLHPRGAGSRSSGGTAALSKVPSRSLSTMLVDVPGPDSGTPFEEEEVMPKRTRDIIASWQRMVELMLVTHPDTDFHVRECWQNVHPARVTNEMTTLGVGLPVLFRDTAGRSDCVVEKTWTQATGHKHSKPRKRTGFSGRSSGASLMSQIPLAMSERPSSSRTPDWMIHPDSFHRMVWAVLGFSFIVMDIFYLSMAVFGLTRVMWLVLLDALYWSCDVCLNFCIGNYHNDRLEMRRRRVARHYLRTWFLPDIVLVSVQWLLVIVGAEQPGAGLVRYARIMRFARLLRLAKFNRDIRQLILRSQAMWVNLGLKIAINLVSVAVWVHLVGTCWYWIGDKEGGWTRKYDEFQHLPMSYLVSVHWAASQLQGGIDIYPTNDVSERSFAVVTLLASVAVLAMVVSRVTNVLHALQIANRDRNRMTLTARKFMEHHGIRSELSLQIYRYLAKREVLKARMGDDDSEKELLLRLPVHLRRTLLHEARWPMVKMHILFLAFASSSAHFKQLLLCDVLQSVVYLPDDVIFQYGTICARMYVVVYGDCHYLRYARTFATVMATGAMPKRRKSSDVEETGTQVSITDEEKAISSSIIESVDAVSSESLEDGFSAFEQRHRQLQGCHIRSNTTLAEAILWTNWVHVGDLEAVNETPMFTINIRDFTDLVTRFAMVQKELRTHAHRFVDCIKGVADSDHYSDLLCTESVMAWTQEHTAPSRRMDSGIVSHSADWHDVDESFVLAGGTSGLSSPREAHASLWSEGLDNVTHLRAGV